MRSFWSFLLPVVLPVALAAIVPRIALAAAGDGMSSRAERAQREAEEALGRQRQGRLEERRSLTASLQSSYARLAEVRRRVEKIEAEVERRRADHEKSAREVAALEENTERLLRGLLPGVDFSRSRHPGEDAAGAASEGAGATPEDDESFLSAVKTAIDGRLAHLDRALALRVEESRVMDRSGRPVRVPVLEVGAVMRLAAGDRDETRGLLVEGSDGTWRVDGVRFSETEAALLSAAARGSRSVLPIDVDGSLAHRGQGTAEGSGWPAAGGMWVWPILLVGLIGLALLAERLFDLLKHRSDPARVARVVSELAKGRLESARALVSPERSDLDRVLAAGVETFTEPRERREAQMEAALYAEEPRLERSLTLIATAVAIAPLLGLLGTVTGMITTFGVITEHGTGNPRLLSGGISVALITTELGLMVAIPLLLGHAFASRLVERRQALLEECRTTILGLEPGSRAP